MSGASLLWGHSAYHFGAVLEGLFGLEGSLDERMGILDFQSCLGI